MSSNVIETVTLWRPRTPSDPKSSLIGLAPVEFNCLNHILSQYPHIVYLAFTMWRRLLVLLEYDPEDNCKEDNAFVFSRPPLPLRIVEQPHDDEHRNCATNVHGGHLGICGDLRMLSERYLPPMYLRKCRPMSRANLNHSDADNTADVVGAFFNWAIRNNQIDVVNMMLSELKIRVLDMWESTCRYRDSVNLEHTPIHCATSTNRLLITKLLIAAGANVNHWDECDRTPLLVAAEKGSTEVVEFLLTIPDVVSSIDQKDDLGGTALSSAAYKNDNARVIELLIRAGGDLSIRDGEGMTLLHLACTAGGAENVKVILRHGADPLAVDNTGRTPLDTAVHDAKDGEVVKLLLAVGPKVRDAAEGGCRDSKSAL